MTLNESKYYKYIENAYFLRNTCTLMMHHELLAADMMLARDKTL